MGHVRLQPHHRLSVDHQQLVLEQEPNLLYILTYFGVPLPVKELEHDDHVDCAPNAVAMDSIKGPLLLVERVHHEFVAHTGLDRMSSKVLNAGLAISGAHG